MASASEREKELEAIENRNLRVKLGLKRINFSSLFSSLFYLIAYFLPRVAATKIITIYYYAAGQQILANTDQISYTVTRGLEQLHYEALTRSILISFILMLVAAFLESLVYIVKGPLKSKMPTGFNITKARYVMLTLAFITNIISAYYLLTFKSRMHAHYDTFYNTLQQDRMSYLVNTYGADAAAIIIGISNSLVSYTIITMTIGYYMAVLGRYLAMFAILAILSAMGKEIEI